MTDQDQIVDGIASEENEEPQGETKLQESLDQKGQDEITTPSQMAQEEKASDLQALSPPFPNEVPPEIEPTIEPVAKKPTEDLSPSPPSETPPVPSQDEFKKMVLQMEFFQETLANLCQAVGRLQREQEIMQSSIRQLSYRVNDAATSLSAPRIRELYLRLLLLYDLVEPAPAHLSEEAVHHCRMIANQIEQFLEVNGVRPIKTEGMVFDPDFHNPIKIVQHTDPKMNEMILSTERKGFRTKQGVLRPADVVIAKVVPDIASKREDRPPVAENDNGDLESSFKNNITKERSDKNE